jgi:hypothetical protein
MSDAALRMALTYWLMAPTAMSTRQRQWLQSRLAAGPPLTQGEVQRLAPPLYAWANGRSATLGTVVAECCGLRERQTTPQQGALDILKRWPGPAPATEDTFCTTGALK